ncbi:hypothetical protein Dda_0772 [Drechslerella dactyloides]|uniref:Manganese lipoxygenase n=1 Tax=Drechslerella dactyloides TaxID=74499 RepID=A0AAD6NPA9_DREDA|nr:hypothetical protein Dda_0772 [Drechslerella dactyloides]
MWRLSIFLLAASAAASPASIPSEPNGNLERRATPYSLPGNAQSDIARKEAIEVKRTQFTYANGIGGGPSSPGGLAGVALVAADSVIVNSELGAQVANETPDVIKASAAFPETAENFRTLDDYKKLYDDQWQNSLHPTGVYPGMLDNYTQDLTFSMERLSFNPYVIRRLIPKHDKLPFNVDDATICKITGGKNLRELLACGSLFYADHRNQKMLQPTVHYAAACDAYFYISPSSGRLLPLAIRTNVGRNLIYTPADKPSDWLLAKMMFNVNDFFHGQFHHLANTHYVTEVMYQAAIRTLSDDHPVLAILKRLMFGAFGVRPLALAILFRPNGTVDQFFGWRGSSAAVFAEKLYSSGYAGDVQNNYFLTNLRRRGLIDSRVGPPLKNFPFHEDALVIYNAIAKFMTAFVNSYYSSDGAVANDPELRAWIAEANGPARAINFPRRLKSRKELVLLLTHVAHLVSSSHHAVNTNQLITGAGSLPFNPSALYRPIPRRKGVKAEDLAKFLPPPAQCVKMLQSQANFARPLLAGTSRSLVHMFDDADLLSRLNEPTRRANQWFVAAMRARSAVVKARTFDARGLSQGMPFVWQALDPDVAPWSLTI